MVCETGISLSPCIVLAYLIKEKGMVLGKAIKFVQESYPGCMPQDNLMYQLGLFQKSVR